MSEYKSLYEPEFAYSDKDFRQVQKIAKDEAGITIPDSKKSLVFTRVSRRIRLTKHKTFSQYLSFVTSDDGERELNELICSLTTNVTKFFRENSHFDHLNKYVMPSLKQKAENGGRVRLWSAACSSGEEAWSMAMTVISHIPQSLHLDVRLLGTDINETVLDIARFGVYNDQELDDVSPAFKHKFFRSLEHNLLKIHGDVTKIVKFGQVNLNGMWPFKGSFDVIFCRNVVIYFDDETKAALWKRLSERLVVNGLLYIGHSERVEFPDRLGLEQIAPTVYRKIK